MGRKYIFKWTGICQILLEAIHQDLFGKLTKFIVNLNWDIFFIVEFLCRLAYGG